MADPENETILSVRTVDSDGKAPKRRIGTPTAAWSSYTKAKDMNKRRDIRFGEIAGIYLGLPPTPPITNEQNGQADLPNINTKQFQAKVNTYTSTWTAIAAQGDGYSDVRAYHDEPMEAERRSKVLTEQFNRAIRLWDNPDFEQGNQYILRTAARDTQMGLYGIGVAFFRDGIDFRFHIIPTRRVLVPDGTLLDLSNCSAMWVEDQMSVTQLYELRNKPGYNEGAILRNLYEHVELQSGTNQQRYTYAEWVNQVRDNDTWILSEFLPVRIIHIYSMEFDGTISHSMMTDLYGSGRVGQDFKNGEGDAGAFIYDKPKAAERWQQVVVPFADNAGAECDWHGVKGFGDLIFDGCHLNNLMFNRAATGAVLANMLMFKGGAENDVQKLDQVTFTQFGLMPANLEIEQFRFQADVGAALELVGYGSQLLAENTRISPPSEKTTTGDQPTATQVAGDRADRAQLTTLQIAIYRAVGLDVLMSEMYRRLAQPASKYPESYGGGKVAKKFREECAKRGIPESELLDICYVRANRNVGSGDLMLDLMKGKELMGVATPGKGQLNARKEIVAALKGVEMVSAFIEEVEPMPGADDIQIFNENNLIQLGQVPTAIGAQDQEKHVVAHMKLLGDAAQAISMVTEQGINPQNIEGAKKLSNLLDAGIQHVGQHLQLMQSIPRTVKAPAIFETFVKEMTKQLNNLQQLAQSFGEDIQKADVAAQPQMSPEMMKAQQEMQITAAKAEQDMMLKQKATEQKLGSLALTTQARTEAKTQTHQVDLQMKQAKTEQDRREKAAQTAQTLVQNSAEFQQQLQQQKEEPKE